jgi:hypothetical protein
LIGFFEYQYWPAESDDFLHVEAVSGALLSRLLMDLCMLPASASALLNVLSGLLDCVLILSIVHGLINSF